MILYYGDCVRMTVSWEKGHESIISCPPCPRATPLFPIFARLFIGKEITKSGVGGKGHESIISWPRATPLFACLFIERKSRKVELGERAMNR